MNERVLIVIILIVTVVPCVLSYGLIRFAPRVRYLPSVLLGIVGLCIFLSSASTKPTGGGISGFGDLPIFAGLFIGGLFILAGGATFLLSFLMYKWWRSRHAKRSDR